MLLNKQIVNRLEVLQFGTKLATKIVTIQMFFSLVYLHEWFEEVNSFMRWCIHIYGSLLWRRQNRNKLKRILNNSNAFRNEHNEFAQRTKCLVWFFFFSLQLRCNCSLFFPYLFFVSINLNSDCERVFVVEDPTLEQTVPILIPSFI